MVGKSASSCPKAQLKEVARHTIKQPSITALKRALTTTPLREHRTPWRVHSVLSSELLLGSIMHHERNTVLSEFILGSTTQHGRNTVFSLPRKGREIARRSPQVSTEGHQNLLKTMVPSASTWRTELQPRAALI